MQMYFGIHKINEGKKPRWKNTTISYWVWKPI